MRILNIDISSKTEQLINDIKITSKRPIEFEILKDQSSNKFGELYTGVLSKYTISVAPNLSMDIFESVILHELRHIHHKECYPQINIDNKNELYKSNEEFFYDLGMNLQSLVLDCEVHQWLSNKGYSEDYVFETSYKTVLENAASIKEDSVGFTFFMLNKYNRIDSIINLAKGLYDSSLLGHYNDVHNAYSDHEIILKPTMLINKAISDIGFDTPEKACLLMYEIIDLLNISSMYQVVFESKEFW